MNLTLIKVIIVKLLQIWLFPNKRNVTNDQIAIRSLAKENSLYQVLSPNKDDDGVWIHQNEYMSEKSTTETFGVYLFVIEGNINIDKIIEKETELRIEFTAEKSSKSSFDGITHAK